MKSGLLWFDNTKGKPLVEKIEDAAARYQHKFGVRPNRAFVHPSDMPAEPAAIEAKGIVIETKHTIMPKHIWIGVDESLEVAHAQG